MINSIGLFLNYFMMVRFIAAKEMISFAARDFKLFDGTALTKLMIQYGLGVSVVHTYEIMRVDSDYFNEGDE